MKPTAYFVKSRHTGNYHLMLDNPCVSILENEVIPLYPIDVTKYKLVPIEPTEEMKLISPSMLSKHEVERIYKYLIEAAPDIEDI